MKLDFEICWQQIKNGDVHALERVYRSSFRSLVIYAAEITGHHYLAEEAVQDVFLKIWQGRNELNIKGSLRAYLLKSVHNQALNSIRQQKTKKGLVNVTTNEQIWNFISDNYMIDDNLLNHIFSVETEALIEKAIATLPAQCNRVFQMSRFESMDNEEIALKLGLSENTVKTHIYRALHKISSSLEKEK